MNKTEYLLTCLGEECNEIALAVAKSLRFGLDSTNPSTNKTNADEIRYELTDLIGVLELLDKYKILSMTNYTAKAIKTKKDKLEHYMKVSKMKGTLND